MFKKNFLFLFFSLFCAPLLAADMPFSAGEELFFRLRWGIFIGGEGSLRVEQEKDAWHFIATGKSTPFLDNIYRVRLRIDARTNAAMTCFSSYEENSKEKKKDQSKSIFFDPQTGTVQHIDKEKTRTLHTDLKSLFDPLSLFYSFRTQNLYPGAVLHTSVTDGKKIIHGTAKAIKKEEVTVPAGTFSCWRIEPDIKDVGGVFKQSKGARMWLWVSADKKKIPLRISTKIALGSITADLTAIKGLDLNTLDSRLPDPPARKNLRQRPEW